MIINDLTYLEQAESANAVVGGWGKDWGKKDWGKDWGKKDWGKKDWGKKDCGKKDHGKW